MIQRTIDIKTAAMAAAFEKESKRLLMCLEEDNLLIVLVDKQNGAWNGLENFVLTKDDWHHMPETLQHIKQQSSLINLKVPDTQLYFRTTAAMPIPSSVKGDSKLFLQTGFGLQPTDEMLTDEVSTAINVSVIVPAVQVTAFRHVFPQVTWNSTLGLLIKQAQRVPDNTMPLQLFLTLSNSLAEIVFIKKEELLIARCFPYHTAEHLLYHLLNTCTQLRISPPEVFIKIQGRLTEQGDIHSLLQQYFTHVALFTAGTQHLDVAFAEVPLHYYSHLMSNWE